MGLFILTALVACQTNDVLLQRVSVEMKPVIDFVPLEDYPNLYLTDLERPQNAGMPDESSRRFTQWLTRFSKDVFKKIYQITDSNLPREKGAMVLTGKITEVRVPPFPSKVGDRTLLVIEIKFTDWESRVVLGEFIVKSKGFVKVFPHEFKEEIMASAKTVARHLKEFKEEF